MNKALKLFTEGDTMEATIVEAFEVLEERHTAGDSRFSILVADSREAATNGLEEYYGRRPWVASGWVHQYEREILSHLEYMFLDLAPSVLVRVKVPPAANPEDSHDIVIVVFFEKDGTISTSEAAEGLADYFAFLYEGYADVYEE